MCVYSMVMDDFKDRFAPWVQINLPEWLPPLPSDAVAVRKLVEDFNKAREAAKVVDELTNQKDCEDPEKIKLVERVAELEKLLGMGVWVVKLASAYWGKSSGYTGWVYGQKQAARFGSKAEARSQALGSNARVVKLVKRASV